ncbi:MAG: hypothetical protein M1834_001306 [Cirrosporium novae-zelandiae]|nr:MAG: hypothetical protein M1834_001306 [Cirrosporium novae-zelandiae]
MSVMKGPNSPPSTTSAQGTENNPLLQTPGYADTTTPQLPSRSPSIYPASDSLNPTAEDITELKGDIMINWLYQQQLSLQWSKGGAEEGIVLKIGRETFICCPENLCQFQYGFYDAICALNVPVAMTVNTRVIKLFLRDNDKNSVSLPDGLHLQVLPSIMHLPHCQKHHYAVFIEDVGILVVWDDQPRYLLQRAQSIEQQLLELVWEGERTFSEKPSTSKSTKYPYCGIRALYWRFLYRRRR